MASRIKRVLISRFRERSTWVWLVTTAISMFGISLAPEQTEAIVVIGMAVGSAVGVFLPDGELRKSKDPRDRPDVWTGDGSADPQTRTRARDPATTRRFKPPEREPDEWAARGIYDRDPRGHFGDD